MLYSRSSYLSLPLDPGVYTFLDENKNVLYVGKAINLKARVSSYFTGTQLGEKTRLLVGQISKIRITKVESELEALLLEAYFIKKYNPRFNIKLTDNKAYVMVRITNQGKRTKIKVPSIFEYPVVLLARRGIDPASVYFGPFPSSSSVKTVLKVIRRVFPFQSVLNHPKRRCLYNHLDLCPCPPVNDTFQLRKEYKKNIRNIIRVFEGKTKNIIKELEKKRDNLSKQEKFEQAAVIQKQITSLSYITQPVHKPLEYDLNPNLRSDLRQQELNTIKSILNENGCNVEVLDRIECYDISHIQGSHTTASMTVLTNGEKDTSQYRRFKIRHGKTPDDFTSMSEVIRRRLGHTEWAKPGLIIVDGGRGQVSSALRVLHEYGQNIPLIGLAKREETIVIPVNHLQGSNARFARSARHVKYQTSNNVIHTPNFIEITLERDSKALHLIQRIRDEAHRFAVTYHKKLRSKALVGR